MSPAADLAVVDTNDDVRALDPQQPQGRSPIAMRQSIMTVFGIASLCSRLLGICGLIAISVLTACGENGSSQSLSSSAKEIASKAKANQHCFQSVVPPNDYGELFAASEAGDLGRVRQAVDAAGNINATDALRRTALFAAAFCGHPEVAVMLIDKGSDINARDFGGMSPLHAAVVAGWLDVARTLIAKGANINGQNLAGHTPLHIAAATNQPALVALLLERGANIQAHDMHGMTAASLASDNGHRAIAAMLRKAQTKA